MPSSVAVDHQRETGDSTRPRVRDIIEQIMQDEALTFGEKLCLVEALFVHDSETGRTAGLDAARQAPREPWRGSERRYHDEAAGYAGLERRRTGV